MKTVQKIEIISSFLFSFLLGAGGLFLITINIIDRFSLFQIVLAIILMTLCYMLFSDGVKAYKDFKEN